MQRLEHVSAVGQRQSIAGTVSFWQAIGYFGAMQTRSIVALLLLAGPLLAAPAAAQPAPNQSVVVMQQAGFAQAAVASCAGGAMIGYLAVLASGAATPLGTAALFCGLSVAATAASGIAVWTWNTTTSFTR